MTGGILFGAVGRQRRRAASARRLGATVIFLIARSAFGEHLTRRAGPLAAKLAEGFRADAFSYLLFLRLVPVSRSGWSISAPALFGVRLATFVAATAIGIIPATFAFAFVGAGLDSVIAAQEAQYNACLAAGRADCRARFRSRARAHADTARRRSRRSACSRSFPVVVKRLRAQLGAAPSRLDRALRGRMAEQLTPDLCVIGAGSGGLSVAAAAAAFGVPVVLIEKGKMGGDCLNTGCVPSKALIAAGRARRGVPHQRRRSASSRSAPTSISTRSTTTSTASSPRSRRTIPRSASPGSACG